MKKEWILEDDRFVFTYEEPVSIQFTKQSGDQDLAIYRVAFKWEEQTHPKSILLSYEFPDVDMYTMWDPISPLRSIPLSDATTTSRLAWGMPMKALVSHSHTNAHLLTLSDVKTPIALRMHTDCTHGTVHTNVEFFTSLTGPFRHYEAFLRIDRRRIRFDDAVQQAIAWFEQAGYRNTGIPDAATRPMYSTWYSYLQHVSAENVLRECENAAAYGMKTVIVDDGWQTENPDCVYGYCGDWKPSPRKFPDMKGFVDRIHALGMKVMLWYAVPFIGKYAENYAGFEGMYLRYADNLHCGVLDPRYRKVREFLIDTYTQAVEQWGLDGLKLDFIDRFQTNGVVTAEMDTASVEDAAEQLLKEITTALKRINPEILIEFRQPYFGPVIQSHANMIRVWDCPLDGATNKTQSINLRLISESCAVHSDMIYWHRNECPEQVALQLYGTMFAVPQISARMEEITEQQACVLKRYLEFWNDHRQTLLYGKLRVTCCENGYGTVQAETSEENITMLSASPLLELNRTQAVHYIVNLTDRKQIFIKNPRMQEIRCLAYDCMGQCIRSEEIRHDVLFEQAVPLGGMLVITPF